MISLEEIRAFERATGIGQSDTSKSTRAGQKDGKFNQPPTDSTEPTGYEKSAIADFVGHVKSFNRLSEAKASELERRKEKARYELEEEYLSQSVDMVDFERRMKNLENRNLKGWV